MGRGLGGGGEWSYGSETRSATGADRDVLDEFFSRAGAHIVGRRMFDVVEGWGYENPFEAPCFVLTHRVDEELLQKAPSFTFVTDGIMSALEQAGAVAGDKDVSISGGANVAQQYLGAGLVDECRIKLEQDRAIQSPSATHLRYRLAKS